MQRIFSGRQLFCALLFTISSLAGAEIIPGEFLVQFKSQARFLNRQEQLNKISISAAEQVSEVGGVYLIRRPSIEMMDASMQMLSNNPYIEAVEPNKTWKLRRAAQDPMFHMLWALKNIGQVSSGDGPVSKGLNGIDIEIEKAWDIETGSKKIKVAVIDTGVNYKHTDLEANIWTNEIELNGKPGVDDDRNGCIDDIHGCNFVANTGDPMDDDGHGTHVAGTIGASANNHVGVVGVAWDVSLIPIKFIDDQDSGTTANAIKSIDYAIAAGAKILSNSWGDEVGSNFLRQAVERSRDAGTLFVAAAGNDHRDNDIVKDYPTEYATDNMISVAAMANTGELASISNFGKRKVHIAAPGENIVSTYCDPKASLAYDSQTGTSMATPHVSGVAALILSKNENLNYKQVKKIILQSARKMPSLKDKVRSEGMLNAYEALKLTP